MAKIQFDIPDANVGKVAAAIESNRGRLEEEADLDLIRRYVREQVLEVERQHRMKQLLAVGADPTLITVSASP